MSREEKIKEFSGRIIAILTHENNGDITVRDFSGRILGYYRKSRDVTTDFSGRVLYYGNAAAALINR